MNDLEKAARMALEALEYYQIAGLATTRVVDSITALRQALSDSVEQPAQQSAERVEPVDWEAVAADQAMTIAMMKAERKPWVGLDHEDIHALVNEFFYRGMQPSGTHFANFGRAIEAKLKEKNA